MDSPQGPVLANLNMGFHRTIWSNEVKSNEVTPYRWYVDDIVYFLLGKMLMSFLGS